MVTNPQTTVDKGLMAKLAFGVSPIPVLGEVSLSWGFYDLVRRNSGQFRINPFVGIPVALITRFGLYTQIYLPIAERLGLFY